MNLRPILQHNRKISNLFTLFLKRLPIHPNYITLSAFLFGVLGGWFMSHGTKSSMLFGALSMHASFVLDNCDGEVARLKGLQSQLGARLDLVSDLLVDIALWIGLFFGSTSSLSPQYRAILLFLACIGSTLNIVITVCERKKKIGDSYHVDSQVRKEREGSAFFSIMEFLSRNGDVIIFVWIMALFGMPSLFLQAGSIYINCLWITRFLMNRKYIK